MMLEDCEVISRLIDEPIETLKALGDLRYNLEVSSPGLFRSLQKKREFDFYLNQPVQVKYKDEETSKEGYLGNFDDARQTFELKPAPDTEGYDVKLDKGVLVYLNPPITVLEMSNS